LELIEGTEADSSTSRIFILLLDIAHQVRLVGMAVLAKHPTVKLDAYRLFEAAMRWSNSDLL